VLAKRLGINEIDQAYQPYEKFLKSNIE